VKTVTRTERKRDVDIDDIFSTFDEEFEAMRAHMDQIMGSMLAGQTSFGEEANVYGVSMHMGPDGKPLIREFGNIKRPALIEEDTSASREPLVDVIEEKDRVRVIVELPGVQKDDIAVTAQEGWLSVKAVAEHKQFSKNIELPFPVRPDSMVTSYKNGVLEITMDREPPKRRKKKTIVP
jgi:HSP20 family protein